MLTDEQRELIRQRLQEVERRLARNAQLSLQMSRDRETDTGRDSIDQSTSEGMLSTDLRLRDREKKLLAKIRGAIQRLEEGTLDECEDCGEPIGFKRLMARPVTTLCIECKESREEQERLRAEDVVESFDEALSED
jgi:DnaK suppressor protein